MLQDRFETDKLFRDILKLTNAMDPLLVEIDQLLDGKVLYQLIRHDLAQRYPQTEHTGRNSTPVEVIMRMLPIKRLYGFSYEQTEHHVRDSLVLRQFCGVYLKPVPDDTTLMRWAALIQPDSLEQFNQRLTQLARQIKVTRRRKLRTDGTVVETNRHPPSDSSLLADSLRGLGRTLSRARQGLGEQARLGQAVFRNRSVRRLARQVGEAMRRGGETAQTEGKAAYQKLVQATIRQAQQVLPILHTQATQGSQKLAETLEVFIPRAKQVVAQTVRRVFQQEKVPAAEKIVSIFEPHTDIIRRNKAHKPTEYGHKVWLDEVDGRLVTRWEVLAGNPSDEKQWLPSLDHHQARFGKPPDQASGDRGLYSPKNERIARDRGVKLVILPQPGRKSAARKRYERQPWFVRGRRWHAGVEGRISVLKRRFGLNLCPDHGRTVFEKWIGWGIVAANLTVIGKKLDNT